MTFLSIRNLISGGVITNYHCPSSCRHCLYNCGPWRSRDYLDGSTAEKIFQTIKRLGCRSVHIGGGEPFLNPQGVEDIVKTAYSCGVAIDYVETNSAWYIDEKKATAILEALSDAGLEKLLISISPFHNEFIPFKKSERRHRHWAETWF